MTKLLACLGSIALGTACGGAGTHGDDTADARPSEADAAVDAMTIGTVAVTVYTRCCTLPARAPVAGASIDLLRPDHSLAATVTTDADGKATLEGVVPGSAVMAVYPEGTTYPDSVTTVLGVEPGDALEFGDDDDRAPTGEGGFASISYPPITAAQIYAQLPCHTGNQLGPSPSQLYFAESCEASGATIPIYAYDDQYTLVASSVLRDVELAFGQTYEVPAWSAPLAQDVRATLSTDVDSAYFGALWFYPGVQGSAWRDAAIAAGVATASFVNPRGLDQLGMTLSLERAGFGYQEHAQTFPADTSIADMSLGDVPWLGLQLASPSAQSIQWIQEGDGGDALVVNLRYIHYDTPETWRYFDWTVIAPVGDNELSWADFPLELPAPRGDDELNSTITQIVDLGSAATYDDVRAAPDWQVKCPLCAVDARELAAAATAMATDCAEATCKPQRD